MAGLCEREHFSGFDLYQRKDLVEVVPDGAHASLFKAPDGLKAFHVEVTLKGVSYVAWISGIGGVIFWALGSTVGSLKFQNIWEV